MRSIGSFVLAAVFVALSVAGVATAAAAPAARQAGPSLNGESFEALEGLGLGGEVTFSQVRCNTTDGTGSASFEASGVATGPFPGTFTESGTVAFAGPPPDPFFPVSGAVTSFQASFTITAADGTVVTGTKRLDASAPPGINFGRCRPQGARFGEGFFSFSVLHEYEATITTPTGTTFADRGFGPATGIQREDFLPPDGTSGEPTGGFVFESFTEGFTSIEPVPDLPARPGKGCGDRNHAHEREAECKKNRR